MDLEIAVRFLLAALWGGIVGAEREFRSKAAGFRTMIMISMGSCFFTIMSMVIGAPGNPDRIASNIVTGIGFLGAGVIFRSDRGVAGITTAASIWAVAAVGMGIGAGYYFASAVASLLFFGVLAVLPKLEDLIDNLNQYRTYTIQFAYSEALLVSLEKTVTDCNLRFRETTHLKAGDQFTITWNIQGHKRDHQRFIKVLLALPEVERFEY